MDRVKVKRYELAVYVLLLFFAIILAFASHLLNIEPLSSILLNLVSELLAVAILFFVVNRFFMINSDDDRRIDNVLKEVRTIKSYLKNDLELKQKKLEQKIVVTINHGVQNLELPVELRRSEFSRAEILGRIGMIPMKEKGKRFSLAYLNTPAFLRQINQILDGEKDATLTIPCDEIEFTQFELQKG